ncbi:Hypothetical_protein [Hexamita inflata]|uniref:Hypothetical_protein n=1 Tax=Hexamita inflata TaxID=28002 RepID=A0ABP1JW46_9EUKA
MSSANWEQVLQDLQKIDLQPLISLLQDLEQDQGNETLLKKVQTKYKQNLQILNSVYYAISSPEVQQELQQNQNTKKQIVQLQDQIKLNTQQLNKDNIVLGNIKSELTEYEQIISNNKLLMKQIENETIETQKLTQQNLINMRQMGEQSYIKMQAQADQIQVEQNKLKQFIEVYTIQQDQTQSQKQALENRIAELTEQNLSLERQIKQEEHESKAYLNQLQKEADIEINTVMQQLTQQKAEALQYQERTKELQEENNQLKSKLKTLKEKTNQVKPEYNNQLHSYNSQVSTKLNIDQKLNKQNSLDLVQTLNLNKQKQQTQINEIQTEVERYQLQKSQLTEKLTERLQLLSELSAEKHQIEGEFQLLSQKMKLSKEADQTLHDLKETQQNNENLLKELTNKLKENVNKVVTRTRTGVRIVKRDLSPAKDQQIMVTAGNIVFKLKK